MNPYCDESTRRNFFTVKVLNGEKTARRKFRSAKIPYSKKIRNAKFLYGESSYGEKSYGEKSYGKIS